LAGYGEVGLAVAVEICDGDGDAEAGGIFDGKLQSAFAVAEEDGESAGAVGHREVQVVVAIEIRGRHGNRGDGHGEGARGVEGHGEGGGKRQREEN
jgi:hypothetical protein